MPVTFEVTPRLQARPGFRFGQPQNAAELLRHCSQEEFLALDTVVQSTFPDADFSNQTVEAAHNGFVWAAIHAFNDHHHLVIRPDDFWLAILTQFNLYVNARQDELRRKFIAKKGQLELEIVHNGPLQTYNWTNFPQDTVSKFRKLVDDRDFEDWILPNFTTTKANDKLVCAAAMMSTLQHHTEQPRYGLRGNGGIPAVTLLGEESDWDEIQGRITALAQHDNEVAEWCHLLLTLITLFQSAYRHPEYPNYDIEHWTKMVYNSEPGGFNCLDGWITAFCFWDERGNRLHGRPQFQGLKWDLFECSQVRFNEIPPGFAAVPVKIDENGQVHKARMIAGSMATTQKQDNTVQSKNVWCIFETKA